MARSPGRSPGEAVFDRELVELRLADALMTNYEEFARQAITVDPPDPVVLEAQWRALVIDPTMATAVVEGFESIAADYFGTVTTIIDVIDTITAVRDYAAAKALTKRATRNLLRESIRLDARALEPVPAELMTVGAKGSPRLAVKGLPFVERGINYRARIEALARTIATGMEGWAARTQAQRDGNHLRWVTMQDDKVRTAHRHAQGQTVPPDEPFMVGGWPMWFPGDPAAPEDLTVNCRCVLASIEPNPNRRYVQRYVPSPWLNASLTAAGNPGQARAPKGSSIGGQWIDTPTAILRSLNRLETGSDLGPRGPLTDLDAAREERRRVAAEVLEREGRPSLEETSERVSDIYSMTTPEQRAAGKAWYSEATTLAQEMVDDPATDLTLEQSAAIIGHLSTQTRWEANAVYARAMAAGMSQDQALASLKAAIAAGTVPKPRLGGDFILDRNWNKALTAIGHPDPIGRANDTLGTFTEFNKTRTFASNIMGDGDGVTIDSHMEDIVGQALKPIGKVEGLNQKLRSDMLYEALSESVRVAAEDAGISPAEMQAVTWGWGLDSRVDARTGHEARLVDQGTGRVLPIVIGGEQSLIDSGDLVAAIESAAPPEDEPVPDYWYAQAEKLLGQPRREADAPPPSSLDVPVEFEEVGWFDPAALTASVAPSQARAPKGTRIGGQWIDTPSAILNALGQPGETPDAAAVPYDVPVVEPTIVIPHQGPERLVLVAVEATELDSEMPPPPVPPEPHVAAVHAYTDGRVAAALNGTLRNPPPDAAYDDMIRDLDACIASTACPDDMYVYRLVPKRMLPHPAQPEGLNDPTSVIGKVIADKGYLSTSIDPQTGVASRSGERVLVRIAVAKGHPVSWVKPFSQNAHENELLFGRETPLAITAIGQDDDGNLMYDAVIAYAASVSASLTAAAPAQARAPKGTSIGGQWIETPSALAQTVRNEWGENIPADRIGGGRRAKYAAPLEDNSPESALQANPSQNMINCQKCTVAYELRRRGMDVVAAPGMGENSGATKGLGDYFAAPPPIRLAGVVPFTDNASDKMRASAEYLTDAHGPNTRGSIQVGFKSTGGAHVFNWEVDGEGQVHYMDAQVGREILGKELTATFNDSEAYSIRFQRLDNVTIGNPAQDAIDQSVTPLWSDPEQAEAA